MQHNAEPHHQRPQIVERMQALSLVHDALSVWDSMNVLVSERVSAGSAMPAANQLANTPTTEQAEL
jgi:hypothetical protein